MNYLTVVRICYNVLIPLQIVAAILIDKVVEPYLILYQINYLWAAALILFLCVVLESTGIKYWILEQSNDLKELIKQIKREEL